MFLTIVLFPFHSDSTVQIEHEDMAVMGLIKSNEWVDLCGTPVSGCTLIAFLLVIYQRSCAECRIVSILSVLLMCHSC